MRAPAIVHCRLLLLAPLLAGPVAAQELTLFEPLETAGPQEQAMQPQLIVNQNGQPAYTVRGTVRVGDAYRVSLVGRDGQVKQLQWRAGERVPVPDAPGYAVLDVQPRSVVLSQPQQDPCIDAPHLGVRCEGAGQSRLSLATAAPLPPTANQPQPNSPVGLSAGQGGAGNAPQNPFEAAIQAQQAGMMTIPVAGGPPMMIDANGNVQPVQLPPEIQATRDARIRTRGGQFQQMRISDDQIPEGMRRVSTPFGDRLIPERE